VRALVAIGLLVATLPATAEEARPKLLLLPIQVHSSEDPEYLRAGLADMLTARFARIGALELIRVDDPAMGTSDLRRALEFGRDEGADYVLYGSFTRFGQGASLDVQCAPVAEDKARAPLREIFVHSGSIGEIIPDLDELAGKVSRFARGEIVSPAALAAAGGSDGLAPTASGADMSEILARIEALEAAVTQLLETDVTEEDIEAATE
jgi:TolB-like protein